jgi:hypothetical protein
VRKRIEPAWLSEIQALEKKSLRVTHVEGCSHAITWTHAKHVNSQPVLVMPIDNLLGFGIADSTEASWSTAVNS